MADSISMPWLGQQADMKPFSRAVGTLIAGSVNAADKDVSFRQGMRNARMGLEDPFWQLKKAGLEKNLALIDLRMEGQRLKTAEEIRQINANRSGLNEFSEISARLGEDPTKWADYVYPGTNPLTSKMVESRSMGANRTLLVKAEQQNQLRFNRSLLDVQTHGTPEEIAAALKVQDAVATGEMDRADAFMAIGNIQGQINNRQTARMSRTQQPGFFDRTQYTSLQSQKRDLEKQLGSVKRFLDDRAGNPDPKKPNPEYADKVRQMRKRLADVEDQLDKIQSSNAPAPARPEEQAAPATNSEPVNIGGFKVYKLP